MSQITPLFTAAAAAAKSLQSCPTPCNPIDGSPPGSLVPGILHAKHWTGLPFPSPMNEGEKWKWSRSVMSDPQRPHGLQPTRLLRPWAFSGQEYWSGVPLPSPIPSHTESQIVKTSPQSLGKKKCLRGQTLGNRMRQGWRVSQCTDITRMISKINCSTNF